MDFKPKPCSTFQKFKLSWWGLLDNLIGIFTLGFIRTNIALWAVKRYCRKNHANDQIGGKSERYTQL